MSKCVHVHNKYSINHKGKRLPFVNGMLYWSIVNHTEDMSKEEAIAKAGSAFAAVNNVMDMHGFSFMHTVSAKSAYVKISFVDLIKHFENSNLPMDNDTLAVSYGSYGGDQEGMIYVNDNHNWKNGEYDLVTVLTHEIFHVLNIGHTQDEPRDIMNEEYKPDAIISHDTISAVRRIYSADVIPKYHTAYIWKDALILAVIALITITILKSC